MTREFDSFDAIQTANFGFVVTLADAETAEKFAYKAGIEDTIKEVLEIIDERIKHNKPVSTLLQARAVSELNQIKHDILALKGGEQE